MQWCLAANIRQNDGNGKSFPYLCLVQALGPAVGLTCMSHQGGPAKPREEVENEQRVLFGEIAGNLLLDVVCDPMIVLDVQKIMNITH